MDSTPAPTVDQICDAIGRRQIADAIGVRLTSVSNAVTDGQFPARWYDVVEGLCAAKGLDCPRRLFSFVRPEPCETLSDESSHDNPSDNCATGAA